MSKINFMSKLNEHDLILREASKIVDGLAEALSPLFEVVLHDLTNPDHAIVKIGNNLSGRKIGEPATELGLARISDTEFPDLLVNYPNKFSDGRQAKSTSIGLRDSKGEFVAAICLNMDISYMKSMSSYLDDLTRTVSDNLAVETLSTSVTQSIEEMIHTFAAQKNKDPRSLTSSEKRELILMLRNENMLERRNAASRISKAIGVSRSGIYYYINNHKNDD